jgi:hypothetical protein
MEHIDEIAEMMVEDAGGGLGPDDVLYLRSDSTDGSQDFTGLDLGPNSYGITHGGSSNLIRHEATGLIAGYGDTSIYNPDQADVLLTAPGGLDFVFTGDFTIGFWFRFDAPPFGTSAKHIAGNSVTGPRWIAYVSGQKIRFFNGASGLFSFQGTTLINDTDPHYYCVDRFGTDPNNISISLDGVIETTLSNNNTIGSVSAIDGINFMALPDNSLPFQGSMDGFRISNGTSLYQNANFAPPTTPPI